MYSNKPPILYQWMLPNSVQWSLELTDQRRIALTFDDGPNPETTPLVLEILKEYGAKSTFFCTGKHLRAHPELLKAMVQDGHLVGNHGFSHLDGWKTNTTSYCRDVFKENHLYTHPIFRPPYGRIRLRQAKALEKHYRIVMWSLLSGDFDARRTPQDCLNHLIRNTRDGDIVVFHDSRKAVGRMLQILPKYLDFLKESSYLLSQCG